MQNIEQAQQFGAQVAKTMDAPKTMKKIINTRSLNQNIYNLFLQKRYKQCIGLIQKTPKDEFKLYIRALIAKQQFKLQEALGLLSECQAMNKLNFAYLKDIAKSFFLLGKYKSSLQVAKDAYKINNDEYQIFYIMGKISLALNDAENAITHFKHSINKQPNEQSYLQLARINLKNNNYVQAAQTVKEALNFSSQNPELYEILGEIYLQSNHKDQSMTYFKDALERDAQRYNSLLPMAVLSLLKEDITQASEYFKKAYKISPNSAALWNDLGMFMYQKKKVIAAYSCLKRAIFLDPFRWDIHANMAIVLMNNSKYLAAHVHLRSAISIQKQPFLYNLLGICLSSLKDFSNAQMAFQSSLSAQRNEQVSYNYITCLIKAGKSDKAKKQFQKLSSNVCNPKIKQKLIEIKQFI